MGPGGLDALVLERILRAGDRGNAIEEGWFLRELETRFELNRDELARRFDRTPSWVSRRLGLVRELPESVQAHVRAGAIGAHAAMRYLVPLARANADDCEAARHCDSAKSSSRRVDSWGSCTRRTWAATLLCANASCSSRRWYLAARAELAKPAGAS